MHTLKIHHYELIGTPLEFLSYEPVPNVPDLRPYEIAHPIKHGAAKGINLAQPLWNLGVLVAARLKG